MGGMAEHMTDPTSRWLIDAPKRPKAALLLTHGAGAGMETAPMSAIAHGLAAALIHVVRFELAFMAARRTEGKRRPPPRIDTVVAEFGATFAAAHLEGKIPSGLPIFVGGKSLGGRAASMLANDPAAAPALAEADLTISGAVAFGYPFHPPKKTESLRTAHLESATVPVFIAQGERDPFGTRQDVVGYSLSDRVQVTWIGDGDHDLIPRKKSGRTAEQNWTEAARAAASFMTE